MPSIQLMLMHVVHYTWAVMLHVKHTSGNRESSQNVMSFSDTCFHGLTLSCSSVLSICGAIDYGDLSL
jgi:hypothetical protein